MTFVSRLLLLAALCIVHLDCEIYEDRPKIKTSDGNLILEPALDRNIYLRPNGPKSTIYVGNVDILKTGDHNEAVQPSNQPSASGNNDQSLQDIIKRLETLENRKTFSENDLLFNISLLWRKVNNIRRKVLTLEANINNRGKDQCQSNPCEHGGTCLNLVNGYHCLCPPNWEGRDCDVDVNECRNFAGTDLGCQNGATCINRPGSYECLCKSGWFGLHCTRKAKDCSGGDFEMCGHGTCVQVSSGEGIQCLCHQGWTNNGTGVACLTDVNECDSYQGPRCSVNPKVDCINLPGTFRCGQCPPGYQGDGYVCNDIDECTTIANGGCSPMVTCHNTIGSRICGPCPQGYQGDGVTCTWRGSCNIGHGGCHPSAQCIENPTPTGQAAQCICPEGMEGDGIGFNGCYVSTGNSNFTEACLNNPCGSHGRCHVLRSGYTCICFKGYGGAHCDTPTDACSINPCRNGGICRADDSAVGGFRCECTAQYSGRLCQVRAKSCGGVLDSEEGSIVYPLTNTTYNNNTQCAWVIHTVPDKVINVTFTRFNVEQHPECSYDFLQIHDGRKSSSQLIGRFCGNTLPKGGNIISSHNNLYFWFHADKTISKGGFALHWTSVTPVCGGEVDATTHGHISSPGSPGPYPPNRDCFWHLTTNLGKRISLHFFALDIETHSNCSYDYLAIYDGEHQTDPVLGKYCNSSQPAPVQSAGSDILIHFHSDMYGSGRGFQIAYAPVEGVPGCGGLYTARKGELVSPTYNGLYLNNLLCEYKIKTSPDTKIKIDFKSFKLERGFRCKYDYLKIYDGPSEDSRLVGKFCGTTYPRTYTSSSNTLYFKFRSDNSLPSEGFKIAYEEICETTIMGDSGVIKSPGYPFTYPDNKQCIYIIRTTPGKSIQLTFQDFDVEDNRYYNCRYDSVEIRDGHDENSTLLGKYCGGAGAIPPVQTSTHNYMYIKFTSDASLSGTGFYANYTTIDAECGGIHRETTGLINHPSGNDDKYKNYQTCQWLLIAPQGMHIKLTWNRFDIEDMPSCGSDYLKIIEIEENNANNELGRFCGTRPPPALTTSTNRLMLQFRSDGSIKSSGFSVSYTFLDEKTHCGANYIKSHGFIYSPGWPNSYEPNRDCTWTLTVPVGQQIALNISEFNLERPIRDKCNLGDYLEIRNGGSVNAPLIGQYCGTFSTRRIISLSNKLYLHFHSDFYLSGRGFQIEWDGTIMGCGGTLTSPSGSISSPNYPDNYHENAECFYKLVTSEGSRIYVTFTELDLERTPDCRDDYVAIYDGRDTSAPLIGKHCYLSPELTTIQTTTNYALIKFRSDIYQGGKGFLLNYHTLCNNNITGRYGVIESPGYPGAYPLGLNCVWTIEVSKGSTINATFTHFDIYESRRYFRVRNLRRGTFDACQYDFLQIKELPDPNYSDKYCGSKMPRAISTKSNKLQIKFTSGNYYSRTGFRLEWVRYGCGGHLQKSSGTFSLDKSTTDKEMDCEWLIETQVGKSITFLISNIYMTDTPNCTTDAIEVYNGQSTMYPLLTKVCHRDAVTIKSDSNYLFVRFVKRSHLKNVFFSASYYSTKSKCGGLMDSRFGIITSKNYPKNYDNNLDCLWYIRVPSGHRVELNFIDLDLYTFANFDDNEGMCGDSIQVYDSELLSVPSNYSYRICPNANKTQIVSKFNNLMVQFKSDAYGTAKGFKANFTVTCGATIKADRDGIIRSEDFLQHTNRTCTWTILAEKPDQKISLTLTLMSLPKDTSVVTNRNCPSLYLRVLDGNDERAPIIGEYCGRKVPPMIVSRGSALTVQFGSYVGNINGLFAAHYSPLSNACGGTLTSEEGTIASPNYPGPYPANSDCEWLLKASPGNTAYVQFETLDLELSERCNEDYVEVRENNGAGPILGVYCGNDIPTNHSTAGHIYIKFHSNSKIGGLGFLLHYGFQRENYIQGDSGEITSPLYPTRYLGSGEYVWRIESFDTISISIDKLEIYSLSEQNYNKLTIHDGYDSTAPVLEELNGVLTTTKVIQSSSNVVYMTLTLDETNKGSIFHMFWVKAGKNLEEPGSLVNCGNNNTIIIVLPGQPYTFSTPNYPDEYKENSNCEWIFLTKAGYHLGITFTDFDLEEIYSCFADSVSIYSSDNELDWKPVIEGLCTADTARVERNSSTYMKVNFKSDASINRKGFNARVRSKCGGVMTALSGEIGISSNSMERPHYPATPKCEWKVKVRPGRTIKLDFTYFNITNTNNDCENYVILRNGDSDEAPLLSSGKYCGYKHEIKENIITSSNSLYVSFTLGTYAFQTFKIHYEEQHDECGTTTILTSDHKWEVISSPNYPSVPVPYSECEWVFTGPPGEILRIDFIDRFDLDNINGCGTEVVEIRDGSSSLAPLKGRYCGEKPGTIKTRGNSVYIKYITQLAEPRNGFKANVSVDICGGTIIAESGVVTSPGYPQMQVFPIGTVCEWRIVGPRRNVFNILPEDIELPESESTCATKVTIEELIPANNSITVIKRLCHHEEDKALISTSTNEFSIKLYIGKPDTWDQFSENKGFRISFNSSRPKCGGTIRYSDGFLTSPNYPQETTLRYCQWIIKLPNKSRRIRLEILDMDIEKHRIGIFDDVTFAHLIQTIPSDDYVPGTNVFRSSGSTLTLYLWMLRSATSHRFKARFSSDEPALCGGDLADTTELTSPAVNHSYTCEWNYNAQVSTEPQAHTYTNFTYQTIFISVIMNSSITRSQCRMFDPQLSITSLDIRYRFSRDICGNTEVSYRIPSPAINLLATKSRRASMYFHAQWKPQPCGGVFQVGETPVNIISVPDFYNDTLDCSWIVNIPVYTRVELKMEGSFNLDCDNEFLKISGSLKQYDPDIGEYCSGKKMESPISIHFRYVYIQYHSNVKNNTNIKLMARTVTQPCGGILRSFERFFTSPNYPKNYLPNQECLWTIEADIGFRVSLKFIDRFVIEDRVNCTKDAVIIYDWIGDKYTKLARLCGRQTPAPYNSTYNRMKVLFRTDADTNLDGFKAEWDSICGGNYEATENEQILYSPGYPYGYHPSMNCVYKITAPNNRVALKFLDFELEGSTPDCPYDNLTLQSESSYHYTYNIYCGDEVPTVPNQFEEVSLIFKSDRYLQKKGFRLVYSIYNCGGKINSSTVLTPTLTNNYDENMNCSWYITAPSNKIVILKFLYIDLESTSDCGNDYVAVYNGQKIDEDKRMALMCGHDNSTTTLRSTGNTMVLQFVSDSTVSYRGFKVQVYFSYSEAAHCGGRIDLTTSSSHSLKSPFMGQAVYENYLDCHWSVISPPDTVIKIEFTSFHVAPCQNLNQTALGISKCDCDLVEVRDGFNPKSLIIGTYCGHTLPPQLTSSGNMMSVTFSTDGEIQSQGFEATLTVQQTPCGRTTISVSHTPQRLKSPGFDRGSIPRGLHCAYHLNVGDDMYAMMRVTVFNLDLQPPVADGSDTKRCNRDKLIIASSPGSPNITYNKDLIISNVGIDYFSRNFMFDSDLYFPNQFELCGRKDNTDFYVYGATTINLITSSESDSKIHKGVEIEVAFMGFCGRNYSEPFGRVQSTYGIVSRETNELDCYTLITAPENHTISAYFISAVPDYWEGDCYLEIFDGNLTSAPLLKRISGEYESYYVTFSTGKYMLLHNHRTSESRVTFDLTYVTTSKGPGCGGKLVNEVGRITSPNYPNTYRNTSTCEWELETPLRTQLLLRFVVFDLGSICNQNYLQLVDSKGVVVRTFCSETPADYKSDDNYVKVVFVTTKNNGGSGWVADFVGINA